MSFERPTGKFRDNESKHTFEPVIAAQRVSKAPGRTTQSGKLSISQLLADTQVQHEAHSASQSLPLYRSSLIDDWTDVAVRPDLYHSPVLRASPDEIGTSAPPYHEPIRGCERYGKRVA